MAVALLICFASFAVVGIAQERTAAPIELRGSLSTTAEAYTSTGEAPSQRYMPRYGARVFFRPVVRLFGEVELPFEFSYSAAVGQRAPSSIVGPLQPFNQFGLSPRITSWLRLHGGYFSLQLSELSFGELRVLGGGLELTPGPLRLRGLYGIVQHPRPIDTVGGYPGAYRRWVWGGSVGFGTDRGAEVALHYVRLVDDTTSIRLSRVVRDTLLGRSDTVVTPGQDNAVAALSFQVPLTTGMTVRGEIAVSAFSSSIRAQKKSELPDWLFASRYSSNIDGAATVGISIVPSPSVAVNLNGRWIGPGFYSLGYPQLFNDVAEVSVSPQFSFAERAVSVRLSGGLQWNNLRKTRLGTSRRIIAGAGVGWQPSQNFGVDAQYSNYGMRMQHDNDTFRVQNVYHSVSLSPRWQFSGLGGMNSVAATYAFSKTDDRNPVSRGATQQQAHSLFLSHSLLFPSLLGLTTTASYALTEAGGLQTRIWMLGETVSYPIVPEKLNGSAGLSVSRTHVVAWDTQWGLRLSLSYHLKEWGTLTWSTFLNRSERSGRRPFTELHTSLNYGLNF
ncbi:MAG: hypothetical protein ABDH31_01320 [Chlorobiota bacterium]